MHKISLIAAGVIATAGTAATATVTLTYGFTDLSGAYAMNDPSNPNLGGSFSAMAGVTSAGDVTRLATPGGTATFLDDFVNRNAFADVAINISVFNRVGMLAQGSGTFTITDADGDQLIGDIDGTWIGGSLGVYFNGDLSNVRFVNVSTVNNTFDGVDGGSFGMDLPGQEPFIGAYVQLFLRTGNMGFFGRDFSGISVQAAGEIIPAPGSLALAGVAGLLAIRRRRA
ncbi:MAG: hypothetical protein KF866_06290 [Phycisphaeraceae bacterium]|nr:hypothetical protein [Phycisphaeraceae bacterium]MCW5754603.1 hypothetical protein [Phycisphaeraceae bacterium]